MRYASLAWAQNNNSVKRLRLLQRKSLRLMFFQSRSSHIGPLFKTSKILKSFNKTALKNCIFISKSLKRLLPSIFNNWFKFSFETHSHDTRWSNLGYLKMPSYHTKTYDRYSMFVNSIYVWNHLQSCHQNVIFHQLRANKLKEILINLNFLEYHSFCNNSAKHTKHSYILDLVCKVVQLDFKGTPLQQESDSHPLSAKETYYFTGNSKFFLINCINSHVCLADTDQQ